jgi:hypothetical protein
MRVTRPEANDLPGGRLRMLSGKENLDFVHAKELAKAKAREFCRDPMLLSWFNGRTGESYPNLACGRHDRPAWIVFAESRGGDLTIDVDDGAYVFIYLRLA